MQFLTSLFGGSASPILTAVFALVMVIVLIVLGVWLLKVLSQATGNVGRGRNRRLSIVDSLAIDQKRQLLIVRRDGVEHLILTGGTQDLLIESGIPVEVPAVRLPMRRPAPNQVPRPAQSTTSQHPSKETEAVKTALPPRPVPTVQMRELGHPSSQNKSPSLRHTGLMRPVTGNEPVIPANSDNSTQTASDSARTSGLSAAGTDRGSDDDRQAAGGDVNYEKHRDDPRKVDGN